MSGWYGEKLYSFGIEMLNLASREDSMGEAILYQLHSLLAAQRSVFADWHQLSICYHFSPGEYTNSSSSPNNNSGIMCISQHYHYELSTLNEIDIALFAAEKLS